MVRGIAVLGFHKIGEPANGSYPTWNYISATKFRDYLTQLRDAGWQVLSAEAFCAGLDNNAPLPDKSALITFDDGYRSTLTEALPILEEFKYPGVIFVPTQYVGRLNIFDLGVEPEEQICTWTELRELQERGVSVHAHSVTHSRLSTLDPATMQNELVGSRLALEEGLGGKVTLFAYPYGDAEHPLLTPELMTACGYSAAFLYGGSPFRLTDPEFDRFRIPRLALGPDTDLLAALAEQNP